MITKVKTFQLVLIFLVVAFSYGLTKKEKAISKRPEKGVAIVELFTSEGCSSCPPADRLLSKIAAENKDVYVLSYHVDYWDHLGWKDPFSQSAFTNRQRQYAKRFNLESIYTPQIVVNGLEEFVGSDKPRLQSSLSQANTLALFSVNTERKNAATINIVYRLKGTEPGRLHIALVQPQAVSVIKRGENRGRTLHHVNVVRQLKIVDTQLLGGLVKVDVPVSLQHLNFELILFTQHERDNRITAASRVIMPSYDKSQKK